LKKIIYLIILSTIFLANCEESRNDALESPSTEFNSDKWKFQEQGKYPHRGAMVDEVLYGDRIRSLKKSEVLDVLGDPDREEKDHLYYTISQTRLGNWPLSTQTLVIKFKKAGGVDWIKLHG